MMLNSTIIVNGLIKPSSTHNHSSSQLALQTPHESSPTDQDKCPSRGILILQNLATSAPYSTIQQVAQTRPAIQPHGTTSNDPTLLEPLYSAVAGLPRQDSTSTRAGVHGFDSRGGHRASRPTECMSESEAPSGPNDADLDTIRARLDVLEGWQDHVQDHVLPRIDDLEAQLAEKDDHIRTLENRVMELEAQLEMLDGLAEDQQSTPTKRAVDLARAMVRQAGQSSDGRVARYYKEVKQDLATLGHDDIHDPQAYQAMEDVAGIDGFGTMTVIRDDRDVEAVYVNLGELDRDGFVNEINNGEDRAATDSSHDSATTTT